MLWSIVVGYTVILLNLVEAIPIDNELVPTEFDSANAPVRTVCNQEDLDLMFIVDGSSSIGKDNFVLVKRFLSSLLDDATGNGTWVSFVQFSGNVRTEFSFNTYKGNIKKTQEAILKTGYLKGTTRIGKAMSYALGRELVAENGDRPNVPNLVITFTDGRSQDDPQVPADVMRDRGMKTVAVGITDFVDDDQLLQIAGDEKRIFKVSDFSSLDTDFKKELSRASTCVQIREKVQGDIAVRCLPDSIEVSGETKNPFEGHLYVKGRFKEQKCNMIGDGRQKTILLNLPFDQCGTIRRKSLNPRGVFVQQRIFVSFHQKFVTKVDRVFDVQCFYMEADKTVENEVGVSQLTTNPLDSKQFKMPVCKYTIHRGSPDGPQPKYLVVGDAVFHKWTCDDSQSGMLFAMKVHNCYVDDGRGQRIMILGDAGCSIDKFVLQDLTYVTDMMAHVEAHVFKFADRSQLRFQCQISLCVRELDGCQDTPPTCPLPTANRQKRGFLTLALDDGRVVDVNTKFLHVFDPENFDTNSPHFRVRAKSLRDRVEFQQIPVSASVPVENVRPDGRIAIHTLQVEQTDNRPQNGSFRIPYSPSRSRIRSRQPIATVNEVFNSEHVARPIIVQESMPINTVPMSPISSEPPITIATTSASSISTSSISSEPAITTAITSTSSILTSPISSEPPITTTTSSTSSISTSPITSEPPMIMMNSTLSQPVMLPPGLLPLENQNKPFPVQTSTEKITDAPAWMRFVNFALLEAAMVKTTAQIPSTTIDMTTTSYVTDYSATTAQLIDLGQLTHHGRKSNIRRRPTSTNTTLPISDLTLHVQQLNDDVIGLGFEGSDSIRCIRRLDFYIIMSVMVAIACVGGGFAVYYKVKLLFSNIIIIVCISGTTSSP